MLKKTIAINKIIKSLLMRLINEGNISFSNIHTERRIIYIERHIQSKNSSKSVASR